MLCKVSYSVFFQKTDLGYSRIWTCTCQVCKCFGSLKGKVPDTPGKPGTWSLLLPPCSHRTDMAHGGGGGSERKKTKPTAWEFRVQSKLIQVTINRACNITHVVPRAILGLFQRTLSIQTSVDHVAFGSKHLTIWTKIFVLRSYTQMIFDFSSNPFNLKDFQACHTSHLATFAMKGFQPTGSRSLPREAEEEKFLANR